MKVMTLLDKLDDIYITHEGNRHGLNVRVISNNRIGVFDKNIKIGEVVLND